MNAVHRSAAVGKAPKTRQEIEQLIVADLQGFVDCENALEIRVISVVDRDKTATWTVSGFNPGESAGEDCDRALQIIVPRFQRMYDMVCKH